MSHPNSDDSDTPPHASHRGPGGVGYPREGPGSSCDEAESISSSPHAPPLRLMQQLMSHGKGMSHASQHAAPAQEADLVSRRAGSTGLLRQASRDCNASSSKHMRVAGPSHGSDSRFAAMKSLTRSAISPRHAVSLDSPATLAATRRRGTLATNHHPSSDPAAHARNPPAECSFDLDPNSLSPASSFGGSAGGSFTEGRRGTPSASLTHLVSAPVPGSFSEALAAAASFGDPEMPHSVASPAAPLLAPAEEDSSTAEQQNTTAAGGSACEAASHDLSFGVIASHSITDCIATQTIGQHLHSPPGPPPACSSATPPGIASHQHADSASVMLNLPVALSCGASKQLQQVPLSQDSLDFALDPVYAQELSTEASDSQQLLLHSTGPTSSSLLPDDQAALQPIGSSSSLVPEDEQTMPQNVLCPTTVTDRSQQQSSCSSPSPESDLVLDRHDLGSLLDQQDQQLPHGLMPAVSSKSHVSPDPFGNQLNQPLLAQLEELSTAMPEDQEGPVLSTSEVMRMRADGLMAIGISEGATPPLLPVAIGNAEGAAPSLLPVALGSAAAHSSGGCPERQQVGCLPSYCACRFVFMPGYKSDRPSNCGSDLNSSTFVMLFCYHTQKSK